MLTVENESTAIQAFASRPGGDPGNQFPFGVRPKSESKCMRSCLKVVNYSSGSGLPLVSGANGKIAKPMRKMAHMVMAE